MSNAFYAKGAERLLSGSLALLTDTIKAVVVKSTYLQNLSVDEFYSDISAYVLGAPVALAGKSVTGGVFDATDPVFAALANGNTVEAIVLYKDTGVAGTSPLIAYIDQCSGLPLTTDGGNFEPTWDNGPYKIISLV